MQKIQISLQSTLNQLESNNQKFIELFHPPKDKEQQKIEKKKMIHQSAQTNLNQNNDLEDQNIKSPNLQQFQTLDRMILDFQTKIADLELKQTVLADKKEEVKFKEEKIKELKQELETRRVKKNSIQFQVEKNKEEIKLLKENIKQQIVANRQQQLFNEKLENLQNTLNQVHSEIEIQK